MMRLLGGKTLAVDSAAAAAAAAAAKKTFDVNQVSQELEQQFKAGIHQKFDAGGQRRGLGA
ncbi:hypothetical protein QBC32DRAFT_342290 [Pseudoneurospora amorphoporcata]|uniref:Small acidic protein n=1 Tax=Pseudoneurospora amorphoporcata TaxID=241081 RepID=A0AAN6SGF3_9PEZI|nr:hypothetical protein QBC32DRAFT_342290 [Pseudoneurospora amorphoporcata]